MTRKLCFVIGPIGKDASPERKHADMLLNVIIKDVLEKAEFDYQVRRADEEADPGMINDRVITDILNADLVIADLTGHNPNVFYELGIRHLSVKPTIHITSVGTALPFDTHGHRTMFVDLGDWGSITSVRLRLAEHVRAIQAPGYVVSNPITQARATLQIRESSDPRDKVIAELQERLGDLESRVRRPATQFRPNPPAAAAAVDELKTSIIEEALGDSVDNPSNFETLYTMVYDASQATAAEFRIALKDGNIADAVKIHGKAAKISARDAEHSIAQMLQSYHARFGGPRSASKRL